jgi:hypothetical protein
MSNEERENEDVEVHSVHLTNPEPAAEGEDDEDVEAHSVRANVRLDLPRRL